MMTLYLELLPSLGDYITHAGSLNLDIAETFLSHIGSVEDQVFRNRHTRERKKQQDDARWAAYNDHADGNDDEDPSSIGKKRRGSSRTTTPLLGLLDAIMTKDGGDNHNVTHIIHDDRPREPKDGKKSDAY